MESLPGCLEDRRESWRFGCKFKVVKLFECIGVKALDESCGLEGVLRKTIVRKMIEVVKSYG